MKIYSIISHEEGEPNNIMITNVTRELFMGTVAQVADQVREEERFTYYRKNHTLIGVIENV